MIGFHLSFNWPNFALNILVVAIAFLVWKRYRRRAMAKDHVAQASRDAAIPSECAGCGSPDAPFQFAVRSKTWLRIFLVAPPYFTPSKSFFFRFCLRCSRVLRRRQRFGTVVIVAGFSVLLFVPASLVLVAASDAVTRLSNAGPSDWFFWVLVCAVLASPLVIATGITTYDSAPPVSIVDGGGETIFFSFRNQQFRDVFARANGQG